MGDWFMNENKGCRELRGELEKTIDKLEEIKRRYEQIKSDADLMPPGRDYDLVLLSELFADFYTCLETGFVRISKFFENNLEKSKWHTQLLEKMTISIPEVRLRVISDSTCALLREFLRFRHFKRYYFEFNYERDRIEFLEKRLVELFPLLKKDLTGFMKFLYEIR